MTSEQLPVQELDSNVPTTQNQGELNAQNNSVNENPQTVQSDVSPETQSNPQVQPANETKSVDQVALLSQEENCIKAVDDSNTVEIVNFDDDSNTIGVVEIGKMEYPGCIFITEENQLAVFYNTPFNEQTLKIIINPIGLLETKIVPHPSTLDYGADVDIEDDNMPASLLITYLQDLFDNSSYKTFVFNGVRKHLVDICQKATEISKTLKDKLVFRGPDLTPEIYPPTSKNYNSSINKHKSSGNIQKVDNLPFELINGESTILTGVQIDTIRLAVPYRYRWLSWLKCYDMTIDGVALSTLYSNVKNKMPLLLVIETTDHFKFGSFLSCGLKFVKGYSGSGETFIYRFAPDFEIYKWSAKNSFFVAATTDDISIGGGSTGAAIYLNKYLTHGFSYPCETFNSPQMAKKEQFKILNVEMWHICAIKQTKK